MTALDQLFNIFLSFFLANKPIFFTSLGVS